MGKKPQKRFIGFTDEMDGLNAFQRRLLILCAREIGDKRYEEIRRIARSDKWDKAYYRNAPENNTAFNLAYVAVK